MSEQYLPLACELVYEHPRSTYEQPGGNKDTDTIEIPGTGECPENAPLVSRGTRALSGAWGSLMHEGSAMPGGCGMPSRSVEPEGRGMAELRHVQVSVQLPCWKHTLDAIHNQ